MVIAWRHFRDGDDPRGLTDRSQVGYGVTDFYGQSGDRDYETRQRDPGDYDAWVSQGPINVHARENMAFTDRGVAKVRRHLRAEVRALQSGNEPRQPAHVYQTPIPSYGGDTMLRIPRQPERDDAAVLKTVARAVARIYQDADALVGRERRASLVKALKDYEAGWK